MKGKRHTPEQIVRKLREAEALAAQGVSVPHIAKKLGVSEWTFYRWRKRYGNVQQDEIKRLRSLERENVRLKKLVAELSLEKDILKEAARGNF